MEKFKAKFSNATRAIAVIAIIAIAVSLLMITFAYEEAEEPESAATHEPVAVYEPVEIAAPAPPDSSEPGIGSEAAAPITPEEAPLEESAENTGNKAPELFEVRFVNYDGSIIQSVTAESGELVPFAGTPERNDHVFVGWNWNGMTLMPSSFLTGVPVLESDVLVTAVFSDDPNWVSSVDDENMAGDYIGDSFEFGITPFFNTPGGAPGEDPNRPGVHVCQGCSHHPCRCRSDDNQSTRPPSGGGGGTSPPPPSWDYDYTPAPPPRPIRHAVTFNLAGGTHAGGGALRQTIDHGGSARLPTATREGHTHTGWTGSHTNVTNPRTITANWRINLHTVRFRNYDGTELAAMVNVVWGTGVEAPDSPTRYGHTFYGWDTPFDSVRGNLIITAQHSPDPFDVIFQDWNGAELYRETVDFGTTGTAPEDPERYGHSFTGWTPDDFVITEAADLYITAQYAPDPFDVIFQDWNGAELRRETVDFGTAATPPPNPSRYGHTFSGWTPGSFTVTTAENLYVAAQYTLKPFYVIFLNYNGTEHDRQRVGFGESGHKPASNPNRYGHTFDGWSTNDFVIRSENNIVVSPMFDLNFYAVTFLNWDGSNIDTQWVGHGSGANAPSVPGRGGFAFTSWDTDFSYISSPLTVTALFRQLATGETPTCNHPDCDETEGLCDICDRCEEHCACCIVDGCNNPAICDDCNRCVNHCDCTAWVQLGRPDGTITIIREIDIPEAALMGVEGYSIAPIVPQGTPPLFTFMGRNVYLWAPFQVSSWALVNIVLSILGIMLFMIKAIPAIRDKREKEKLESSEDSSVDFLKGKNKFLLISGGLSIAAIILFFVTQDLTALTALLDIWTIVHTAIFIATIVALKLYKGTDDTDDSDGMGDETEITSIHDYS